MSLLTRVSNLLNLTRDIDAALAAIEATRVPLEAATPFGKPWDLSWPELLAAHIVAMEGLEQYGLRRRLSKEVSSQALGLVGAMATSALSTLCYLDLTKESTTRTLATSSAGASVARLHAWAAQYAPDDLAQMSMPRVVRRVAPTVQTP
jgi:hypothetical protein